MAQGIDGGAGSAGAAFESAAKKATGLKGVLAGVGTVAGGILVADLFQQGARKVQQLVQSTVKAASDLGESVNAVDKTFGSSSRAIQDWGQQNAASFGLSTRAFNQAATPLGAMLKNQGLAMDEVSEHTIKLTERAADMASVFNVDVSDALVAIQAGLRGEADPLERFGVSLNAVAVEQRALADTGKAAASQLTATEKATARLNVIYEQTESTAGDFADTSDGLANSQRIAAAEMENAQAKIGAVFTPVMAKAAQVSGALASSVGSLPQPVIIAGAAIAGLAAVTLLAAPRVVATGEALTRMSESGSRVQSGMAKATIAIGKAAAVMGVLSAAAVGVNAAFGNDAVNVQVQALAESLADYAKNGKLAGEATRVFGDHLKYDLGTLGSGFWAEFGNGFAGVIEMFGDFGQDESLTKAKERIAGIDSAMASLVESGRAEEAAAAFNMLSAQATDAGISVDDLKAGLPAYAAAMQVAAKKTADVGGVAEDTAKSVDELQRAFHNLIDETFGLEEAQDRAADAVADLKDAVKEQKDAHEKGAGSLTGNTQAARDNRDAVRDLVGIYGDLAVEYQKAGKSTKGLQKQLEDQLVAMGFSRAEAQKYARSLAEINKQLDALPNKPINVTVNIRTNRINRIEDALAGEAHGGIIGAASGGIHGGMRWVGEQGPELVRLPYGSTVYPAGQSERMAQQSSGGGSGWDARPVIVNGGGFAEEAFNWLVRKISERGGTLAVLGIRS